MPTTTVNNLRFPGQIEDQETGTFQNYFRDYDPSLGRYMQSDPVGLRGGMNLYGYVEANPAHYIDPTGLCGWSDAIVGFGDAFGAGLIRSALGIGDGNVDTQGKEYNAGFVVGVIWGIVPVGLEAAALLGSTRLLPLLNANRYFRIGEGTFGTLGKVPRISSPYLDNEFMNIANKFIDLGTKGHVDLSSRVPSLIPVGPFVTPENQARVTCP